VEPSDNCANDVLTFVKPKETGVGITEVGITEVGPTEVGLTEVGLTEVGPTGVGVADPPCILQALIIRKIIKASTIFLCIGSPIGRSRQMDDVY
jgi:hypothetical protein